MAVCSAVYVSIRNSHFLCHWLNTVRTFTQSNSRSIFSIGRNIIQPIGKLAIPIDMSLARADTSRRSTAEPTTKMKVAVTVPRSLPFDT